MPPPQTPSFEPQPPAKPIRAPRRPLTGKDFPELAQHEAAMHGERDLGIKRRGGLLDWVTGRTRETADPVRIERQMPTLDSGGHGDHRDPASQGGGGSVDEERSSAPRGEKDTDRARNAEEPLEIPNFFKRPVN
jgi:hypothetical protein